MHRPDDWGSNHIFYSLHQISTVFWDPHSLPSTEYPLKTRSIFPEATRLIYAFVAKHLEKKNRDIFRAYER